MTLETIIKALIADLVKEEVAKQVALIVQHEANHAAFGTPANNSDRVLDAMSERIIALEQHIKAIDTNVFGGRNIDGINRDDSGALTRIAKLEQSVEQVKHGVQYHDTALFGKETEDGMRVGGVVARLCELEHVPEDAGRDTTEIDFDERLASLHEDLYGRDDGQGNLVGGLIGRMANVEYAFTQAADDGIISRLSNMQQELDEMDERINNVVQSELDSFKQDHSILQFTEDDFMRDDAFDPDDYVTTDRLSEEVGNAVDEKLEEALEEKVSDSIDNWMDNNIDDKITDAMSDFFNNHSFTIGAN